MFPDAIEQELHRLVAIFLTPPPVRVIILKAPANITAAVGGEPALAKHFFDHIQHQLLHGRHKQGWSISLENKDGQTVFLIHGITDYAKNERVGDRGIFRSFSTTAGRGSFWFEEPGFGCARPEML